MRRLYNPFFMLRDLLRLHLNLQTILLATLIGLLGGYTTLMVRWCLRRIHELTFGPLMHPVSFLLNHPKYVGLLIPVLGALLATPILVIFARRYKGMGIPEVMEALVMKGGRIDAGIVTTKSIASIILIGTGAPVGKEGPVVQLCALFGSSFGRFFRFSPEQIKVLIGCGAAAGIAASFNAPIAGVMFSIEIILNHFALNTFAALVTSSVIATVIAHHHIDRLPIFQIPAELTVRSLELPYYFVLGAIIALTSVLFMKTIEYSERWIASRWIPEPFRLLVGAVMIGGLIVAFPRIYGSGFEGIQEIINRNYGMELLVGLVLAKIIATSIAFGAGAGGGVFAPSMFIGASVGGCLGVVARRFLPMLPPSYEMLTIAGMGAMLSSVVSAPVTAIVLTLEATHNYHIILPVMIACITSSLISSRLCKESLYHVHLKRRGGDVHGGLESSIMRRHFVQDVMHRDVQPVAPDMSFEFLYELMVNDARPQSYVVGFDRVYMGAIALPQIALVIKTEGIKSKRRPIDLMNRRFPSIAPDASLLDCIRILKTNQLDEIPVVEPMSGQFEGIISYRDIFNIYDREILREGTLGLKFITRTPAVVRNDYVTIPMGFNIVVLPVVGRLVDRSVRELDLRNRYNATIIAINRTQGGEVKSEIPMPHRILTRLDSLIIIGPEDSLTRLRTEIMS